MRNRFARWTLLIPLAAAVACSSSSRQSGTGAGVGPEKDQALVHTYTVPAGEFIRIPLEGNATYRVELSGTGFRLGIKPVEPGAQAPLVQELVPGVGASGSIIYTVRPRSDGVYEIRSIAGDPTQPLTLRIERQPSETTN
ncbi:MAG: hypothetical protein ABI836_07310 [Gemmatimonadota bacterium]